MKSRALLSTVVLASGLTMVSYGAVAASSTPQYAVTELGIDRMEDATLTDSGLVQFSVGGVYPSKSLYEWSPVAGIQLVGVQETPRTELTPYGVVTVLDTNNTGGWVGKTTPSVGDGIVVVGQTSSNTSSTLSLASGLEMYPRQINDQGTVIGYTELPYPYVDRVETTIEPFEGFESTTSYQRYGHAPFVWTPGGGTKIIPSVLENYAEGSGGSSPYITTFSVATAVNSFGQVVGSDMRPNGYAEPAFAYIWSEAAGVRSLGRLAGHNASLATDINDAGVVVGLSGISEGFQSYGVSRAFVWTEADGMQALDALLTGYDQSRGVTINRALSLNESGQILAAAIGGGEARFVLLTPVPEPATHGLMLLGFVGVVIVAKSRGKRADG